MTIASEITRLQGAKADIRQAIIDKGVDVCADLTIDDYACCIDSISTGSPVGTVDVLLVGGGGAGGLSYSNGGGGGGSGDVIQATSKIDLGNSYCVCVGQGGRECTQYYYGDDRNGGKTKFNNIVALGGGAGGYLSRAGTCNLWTTSIGCTGASGGGSISAPAQCCGCQIPGGRAIGEGCNGGNTICTGSGGGGGPGSAGCNGHCCCGGNGGDGISLDFSGETVIYGGGGAGGAGMYGIGGTGGGSGGNGGNCGCCGCPGSNGGGGGGAGYGYCGGNGGDGIAIIRYKKDGSCGINYSEGGVKYECGDYVYHKFFIEGNFKALCIDKNKKVFDFILVGGGGGGGGGCCCVAPNGYCYRYNGGGGGGGDVILGEGYSNCKSFCITIGTGGTGTCQYINGNNGNLSRITDGDCFTVIANGGKGGAIGGGNSGNGYKGGMSSTCCGGGGGAGAGGPGCNSPMQYCGGNGGLGKCGYGGGGGGGGRCAQQCSSYAAGYGCCGGGNGGRQYGSGCNATTCGSGGGGANPYDCCHGGNGANGIAKICYPTDGSYGYTCATGGTCCTTTTVGGIEYCVHRFKSNGTFCIVC